MQKRKNLICVMLLFSLYGMAQHKVSPNVAATLLLYKKSSTFGGNFTVLSNPAKTGQFGAGFGIYPDSKTTSYIPVYVAFRQIFNKKPEGPMIDGHIGYGIYSFEGIRGGVYFNIGLGLILPGKIRPLILFKYEGHQFDYGNNSSLANYFNVTAGVAL